MGARLYNPVTALFTSIDPIWGGNETAYTYPNDPINKQDTTGEWGWAVRLALKLMSRVSKTRGTITKPKVRYKQTIARAVMSKNTVRRNSFDLYELRDS